MTIRSTRRAKTGSADDHDQPLPPSSWEQEIAELTYAQARTALEVALGQLQSEDLEVETMADLYRRALAYAQRCEQVLEQVGQEIIQLDPSDLEQNP
jgi:exodeoxyribonuclease VII small subunit